MANFEIPDERVFDWVLNSESFAKIVRVVNAFSKDNPSGKWLAGLSQRVEPHEAIEFIGNMLNLLDAEHAKAFADLLGREVYESLDDFDGSHDIKANFQRFMNGTLERMQEGSWCEQQEATNEAEAELLGVKWPIESK